MRLSTYLIAWLLVVSPMPPVAAAQTVAEEPSTRPVRTLTLDEAVRLALEQNLDIRVERINPQIQDENIALARASFAPTLTSDMSYRDAANPSDSILAGSDVVNSGLLQTNAGLRQQLPWGGGNYTLGWNNQRSTSNNTFFNFNPRLSSNLQFQVVQPVLRNFHVDATRTQLRISRRNRDISEVDLRRVVVQTVRNVKYAYWTLKNAVATLDVQQQSLELARQTLRDNRTRVDVGTMAPIDIVEAESEVARNEEAVIVAEASIRQAEDQLRALILDPGTPDFWQLALEPADAPVMNPVTVDPELAVRSALDQRTDLRRARHSLENVGDNLRLYRNQMLPQVNLQLDYGTTALGGRQFLRGAGLPGPVIGEVSRGYTGVLGDLLSSEFPTWTLSVNVSYPIGHDSAEVSYARTRLEQEQAQLQLKNVELQIASQVREVSRQVNTNTKRIDATRAARTLAERRLEAEQKKYGVGMSTSFLVFQAQRDLSTARANELQAILDYNKSLADFEAVQETSVSGQGITIGSASAATAGGTAAQSSGTTGTSTSQTGTQGR